MKGRDKPTAQRIASKYELLERAGEGGMAVVWKGLMHGAAGFTRPVAMKQIKPELRHDDRQVAMFVEEARLGSCLLHPNIAQVHDIGRLGDSYFFTMEYVHGETVRALLQLSHRTRRAIPIGCVMTVIAGAAQPASRAKPNSPVTSRIVPLIINPPCPETRYREPVTRNS